MNIFVLDTNPKLCAEYHLDKHVVKMILEYCQVLSATLWAVGLTAPYKKTHFNHPVVRWARQSRGNYNWLWKLCHELGKEYTHRYGKIHKSHQLLLTSIPETLELLPDAGLTMFENCTTHKYISSPVEAYRKYYIVDKGKIASWKNRQKPYWFE